MRSAALVLALGATTGWGFVMPTSLTLTDQQFPPLRLPPSHPKYKAPAGWLREFKHEWTTAYESVEDYWQQARQAADAMKSWAEDEAAEVLAAMAEVAEPQHVLSPAAALHPPHKSDKSIYELLSSSKYTTRFAELLDKHDKFKELLSKADANVTVFVPSDEAFERIPDHAHEPSDEFIEAFLNYHILPEPFSARRIFQQHTLPTLLEASHLSASPEENPQRVSVKLSLRGLLINGYNRVTHRDIFASNGVIHGVSSFNIPPPHAATIISLVPTAFSQFELGMRKTGLAKIARKAHRGSTVFAPANSAWQKLGFGANAFLFSPYGRKYLRAILAYHIVANQTLYSDAYYDGRSGDGDDDDKDATADVESIPKGRQHINLPTLLHGKTLGVDIGRYGRWIDLHVNHYSRVVFQDAIARDGVIHVIDHVLIPPHKHHKHHDGDKDGDHDGDDKMTSAENISVDALIERLEPYLEEEDLDCPHRMTIAEAATHLPSAVWDQTAEL